MKKLTTQYLTLHIIVFLFTLFLSFEIIAAPGDLDLTFDTDGKNILSFGAIDRGEAMAIQNDGKIVVAGWRANSTATVIDAFAIRFNTDGSLDTGFGTNGFTVIDFSGFRNWGYAVAIQADGKIIIAGTVEVNPTTFVNDIGLIRLNSDGTPDTSFGTNGKLQANPIGGSESASAMDLDANGKIVVTGQWNSNMGVARFNSDGTYDNSFDVDGSKIIDIPLSGFESANALAIDSNGNMFIAGHVSINSDVDFAVVKLLSDGTPDTSFSNDGFANIALRVGGEDSARAIALDSDGNIVLAGYVLNANTDGAITKIDPSGSQILSFGNNGSLVFDFGAVDFANAVAIQFDDKIIVGGLGNNQLQVGRFNSNGTIDSSFSNNLNNLWGTNGFAAIDFYPMVNTPDSANALAIDSAGRVIAVGYGNTGTQSDTGIARFQNFGPTAANAEISGRVLSTENGRGVSKAIVYLTDQNGNVKTARTNSFGYFHFENMEVGQTLLINAFHKNFQFNPQVINFDGEIKELTITPQ